mgnify:CR=1 FL=1
MYHTVERKITKVMAGENEKLHIRLHIYDTDMPVVIDRQEEFLYREAAKDINEAVNAYSEVFKGKKSEKEILYMALIDIAYNYETEKSRNDTAPISKTLSQITAEIEDVLHSSGQPKNKRE